MQPIRIWFKRIVSSLRDTRTRIRSSMAAASALSKIEKQLFQFKEFETQSFFLYRYRLHQLQSWAAEIDS